MPVEIVPQYGHEGLPQHQWVQTLGVAKNHQNLPFGGTNRLRWDAVLQGMDSSKIHVHSLVADVVNVATKHPTLWEAVAFSAQVVKHRDPTLFQKMVNPRKKRAGGSFSSGGSSFKSPPTHNTSLNPALALSNLEFAGPGGYYMCQATRYYLVLCIADPPFLPVGV